MSFHDEKLQNHIRDIAAEFIGRESGPSSMITVTEVSMNDQSTTATIYVTVLPETKIPEATGFLKRQRGPFREYFMSKSPIRRVPTFDFEVKPWSASV